MAGDGYYEKSFEEDKDDMVVGLVDYSSSSDDDYHAPSQKRNRLNDSGSGSDASLNSHDESEMSVTTGNKQSLSDSGSDTSLHSHASDDENVMCATRGDKQSLTDSGLNSPLRGSSNSAPVKEDNEIHFSDYSDSEDELLCLTDNDVVGPGLVNYRRIDKYNLPEVYAVFVERHDLREKSKCLKLLDEIGCYSRFRGLSVEMGLTFFADLNRDEAARLKGVKGIRQLLQYRHCVSDI